MKAIKIIFKIVIVFLVFILSVKTYVNLMDSVHNRQFKKVKVGMNISECRNILGKPNESQIFDQDIMDVYYYSPMAEARFFYSQKEKRLEMSWRTDCD